MRALPQRTDGAVYVEYLAAAIPIFIMFLVVVQFAEIAVAVQAVHCAAATAARSALVVLSDSDEDRPHTKGEARTKRVENEYGGSARGDVYGAQTNVGDDNDPLLGLMKGMGIGRVLGGSGGGAKGYDKAGVMNIRAQNILAAAIAKTAAVSPAIDSLGDQQGLSIKNSFADTGNDINDAAQRVNYAQNATSIEVRGLPPVGQSLAKKRVTVMVYYLFACGVPVADQMLCKGWTGLPGIMQGSVGKLPKRNYSYIHSEASIIMQPNMWVPGEEYVGETK